MITEEEWNLNLYLDKISDAIEINDNVGSWSLNIRIKYNEICAFRI